MGMQSTINTTVFLLVTFCGMSIVPLAVAQDPTSDDERRSCERVGGIERKRCKGVSPPRVVVAMDEAPGETEASGETKDLGDLATRPQQIREDLARLQGWAIYLSNKLSDSDLTNLNTFAKTADEIEKHAKRLRSGLALPSSDPIAALKELELPMDRPHLKQMISALVMLIADAVRNPSLKGGVLDVTGSLKARSELDAIVELSGRIKTQCELLINRQH